MNLIRFFTHEELSGIQLPAKFNNPFNYDPHILCRHAARIVMKDISMRPDWETEFRQGKMLGVLVVRKKEKDGEEQIGYITAYSGQIQKISSDGYFVPPVYDLSIPQDFYVQEDKAISELNRQISSLQYDEKYLVLKQTYLQKRKEAESAIRKHQEDIRKAKIKRDLLRKEMQLSPDQETDLQRESQFMKAELRRIKKHFQEELAHIEDEIQDYNTQIEILKHSRKQYSFALQKKIFSHFRFRNAWGKSKDLLKIFEDFQSQLPPAGAGECAAPRLLQYAYCNELQPLAMAEFWYGISNKDQNRKHGCYYPACLEKCAPILSFMLEGLSVEGEVPPPIAKGKTEVQIKILYEDSWLIAVDKPAGMLSIPGKTGERSLVEYLQQQLSPSTELFPAHRLDMDTSGVLLLAKDRHTYQSLQQQFIKRNIKKIYIAKLKGRLYSQKGIICLPICPDKSRRPMQTVDWKHGITAISIYEILEQTSTESRIKLMPLTGRTHQLRVHAADRRGLNCPIVGDPLYNPETASDNFRPRLMLHAMSIRFTHPVLQKEIEISSPCELEK